MELLVYPFECNECHTLFAVESVSYMKFQPMCPNPQCNSSNVTCVGCVASVEFTEH